MAESIVAFTLPSVATAPSMASTPSTPASLATTPKASGSATSTVAASPSSSSTGSNRLYREILRAYGDELQVTGSAHSSHETLQTLIIGLSKIINIQLAGPVSKFLTAYKAYYEGCVSSLGLVKIACDSKLPQLVACLQANDLKSFNLILGETYQTVALSSELEEEHKAMGEAYNEVIETLTLLIGELNANPDTEKLEQDLDQAYQTLRAAEAEMRRQEVLKKIQEEAKEDHGKARVRITERLQAIHEELKTYNIRLKELIDAPTQVVTTRFKRRGRWFSRRHETSTTVSYTDKSAAEACLRTRIAERTAEANNLEAALHSGTAAMWDLLMQAQPAIETAAKGLNLARKAIKELEERLTNQQVLEAKHIFAKALLGTGQPDVLAETVINCLNVTDKLHIVRTYIRTTKQSFQIAQQSGSKVPPAIAILGLSSLLKAPLMLTALTAGTKAISLIQGQQFQNQFALVSGYTRQMLIAQPEASVTVEVMEEATRAGEELDPEGWF